MRLLDRVLRIQHWLAGKMVITDVPDRLRDAIYRQQIASERIIGWIQLFIVIAFSVLYAITPKAFSGDIDFAPVPWFLAVYFAFTVLRLYLTHKERISSGFLILSIVVDMALLFGLIWSFHIQYSQPPSFYLKAPTLMYVFIFIALRALRFEAGFVVCAGMTAALGWMLLSYYAIHETGMENVTRDYVEYLTSSKILIGAEWDKIISILMVTGILAAVISRGQELLQSAVRSNAAAQDLSKFVPDEIARQITEDSQRPDLDSTETGECTILFVDLEAFTTISESMSPEQLLATLNRYFAVAAEPIHLYGGVINQFQGDAILASFNIPRKNTDHARNAILAGLSILQSLHEARFDGHRLQARIGINTGNVTGGLVGIPERVHYTVHGDDVNIASRLESLNKELGTRLLVSEATMQAASQDFEFVQVTSIQLRGRSNETTLYTVIDPETRRQVQ